MSVKRKNLKIIVDVKVVESEEEDVQELSIHESNISVADENLDSEEKHHGLTDSPEKCIEACKIDKIAKMSVKTNPKIIEDVKVVESEKEEIEELSVPESNISVDNDNYVNEEEHHEL
ncbi:hypothetical protein FQR65_LT07133 [Abscondita terminalis]|nr:hypothetical protein FQR65_LT07133 [Abscondita terminalis]